MIIQLSSCVPQHKSLFGSPCWGITVPATQKEILHTMHVLYTVAVRAMASPAWSHTPVCLSGLSQPIMQTPCGVFPAMSSVMYSGQNVQERGWGSSQELRKTTRWGQNQKSYPPQHKYLTISIKLWHHTHSTECVIISNVTVSMQRMLHSNNHLSQSSGIFVYKVWPLGSSTNMQSPLLLQPWGWQIYCMEQFCFASNRKHRGGGSESVDKPLQWKPVRTCCNMPFNYITVHLNVQNEPVGHHCSSAKSLVFTVQYKNLRPPRKCCNILTKLSASLH